jgi:TonB family protein
MTKRLPLSLLVLITCTSLAAAQAFSSRVRVSSAFEQSLLVKKVEPQYPADAKQQHIQGVVSLKVKIDKEGNVETVELISGHPLLAPAAIDAMKLWKFKPYLMSGTPWAVETTLPVYFTLSDKPTSEGIAGDAPGGAPPDTIGGIAPSNPGGPATKIATPQRVRVSSGVAQGMLAKKVNPDYPLDARQQLIQGVVVLKVNIDKDGNVYKVELISGHPSLAPAAIDAVKQWKYKPYLLNNNPVEVETQVQVNFVLQ